MSAPPLNILAPLYAAVMGNSAITDKIADWNGTKSVHTRRPTPSNATYPMIAIGPIIARPNGDGINDFRPRPIIDVNIYGQQPRDYRVVEEVAELVYSLFHRQRVLTVPSYSVTQILASGPSVAPTDDDQIVGRRVTLTIQLYAKSTT